MEDGILDILLKMLYEIEECLWKCLRVLLVCLYILDLDINFDGEVMKNYVFFDINVFNFNNFGDFVFKGFVKIYKIINEF